LLQQIGVLGRKFAFHIQQSGNEVVSVHDGNIRHLSKAVKDLF